MHKKLTIVSDTAIFFKNGRYFAFGPVVNELESFEHLFDEIVWIGFNRPDKKNDLSMKLIDSPKVKVVLLKAVGGKSFLSSLTILLYYPVMFFVVLKNIFAADVIHTRAPSHPALIAVLISFMMRKKVWWNKFAGSWNSATLSFFYGIQKEVLIRAKHTKVTMNGFWEDQPQHCFSFENPCLTDDDIEKGSTISKNKKFDFPFVFIFVGRMESSKGVDRIIEALKAIPKEFISEVHFIGDGKKMEFYRSQLEFLKDKCVFHGFINKKEVHSILAQSHFILLPSSSEGFPKVIAEAACYGVIPIVSDVGSISHYINETNGYLWKIDSPEIYHTVVSNAITANSEELKEKSTCITRISKDFSFMNYNEKLKKYIL